MHRLFFSIKRVHWMWQRKAQKIIGEMIEPAVVTPAQFNLLRTVYTYRHGIVRFKLAGLLGVAAPGVSRMVKMLAKRGFVYTVRDADDRRYVRIHLTDIGEELVEEILGVESHDEKSIALDRRVEEEAVKWFASTMLYEAELDILERFLLRARVRQYETAIYPVPWHGGEILYGAPGTIREPPPMEIVVAA